MRISTSAALTSAAVLLGLAFAPPVAAQSAVPRDGGRLVWLRVTYDTGYREGWRHGERDARARRAFDYRRAREYQRADRGFDPRLAPRVEYRRLFRRGYETGYRDGYSAYRRGGAGIGRGRPPSSGDPGRARSPWNAPGDPAFERGRADGYLKGLDDGRDRDRYDVVRHKWYRSADRGFGGWYGSRERYRNLYREGFATGYARGYRDGVRYAEPAWTW